MKKFTAAILIFAMMLSFCMPVSAAYFGDVDRNGKITASDARTILRVSAKLEGLDADRFVYADVNGDGKIAAADARSVLRMSAQIEDLKEIPSDTETTTKPSEEMSKEDILNRYSMLMTNLKRNVYEFNRTEYQEMVGDYDLGTVGNLIIPIAENVMISKNEAVTQRLEDAGLLPVEGNASGCLLTDADKIKTAEITENGKYTTIRIVLNDEKNPVAAEKGATSCASAVGSMFTPPTQKEIDNVVDAFAGVVAVNKVDITAKDCTAELVFNTVTGEIESLTQVADYYIEVDAKAVIVPISGYATIRNTLKFDSITYADSSAPASKQNILDKYTRVMGNLKRNAVSYEMIKYQNMSDDYDIPLVGNMVLPIAESLIVHEDEAAIQYMTGTEKLPVVSSEYFGCLLTDVSKIKSAHLIKDVCTTTIIIVMQDEKFTLPEGEKSAIAEMFTPLSPQQLKDISSEFAGVVSVNNYDITMKDCTATLVFDTYSGDVESLTHEINYYVEVDARAVVVPITAYCTITDTMQISNIKYNNW